MITQGFFKFHDFSMHVTIFSDFPGFPWFPELVGTLTLIGQDTYIYFYDTNLDTRKPVFQVPEKVRLKPVSSYRNELEKWNFTSSKLRYNSFQ